MGGNNLGKLSNMHKNKLTYFTNGDIGSFAFYRMPKALFTDPQFEPLSFEAKSLYALMLDRMCLSAKNGWTDNEGRVYIIFTVEEIGKVIGAGRDKVRRLLSELDAKNGCGLIERKVQGQGKPSIIFVRKFMGEEPVTEQESVENSCGKPVENSQPNEDTSDSTLFRLRQIRKSVRREIRHQDCGKSATNNTKKNNTDLSINKYINTESSGASDDAIFDCYIPVYSKTEGLFGIDNLESLLYSSG